jgi:DMSO/TMAO reductase YedYZ molybdopterin-dependent catalytic subunit
MATVDGISLDELRLAARNHAMPLEALRYDLTPVGLHYVLIHYDIPAVDADTWRLDVAGAVERPVALDLEEIRARPPTSVTVTMECAGNGRALLEPRPVSQPWLLEAVGNATWTGVRVADLLTAAGVRADAVDVVFTGADRGVEGEVEQAYARGLPLEESMRPDVLVAYEMNGGPLPAQHGFPLRLVVPGWYGMTSVKWLTRIEVLPRPFDGYQNVRGYRMRENEDDPGTPVTTIAPRSLLIPPGIPEFATRSRVVDAGVHLIQGRAWSGRSTIVSVEASDDGGSTWADAELEAPGEGGWQRWVWSWVARPGERILACRATDGAGATQPLEPAWNVGGYMNNAVQSVPVLVR